MCAGILAVAATGGGLRTSLLSPLFLLLCKIFFFFIVRFILKICVLLSLLTFSILKTNPLSTQDEGR